MVTIGLPCGRENDFWSPLSLGPSRGRCGAVSAGDKHIDPVGALIETPSPRAAQIGRAEHKTSLLFMIYFKTTLLMISELRLFISY